MFRFYQALFELSSAAQYLLSQTASQTTHHAHLLAVLKTDHDARSAPWAVELTEEAQTYWVTCANMPEDENFLLATVTLLIEHLVHPGKNIDLIWEFEAYGDQYRAVPDAIRAAIFNGFLHVFALRHEESPLHNPSFDCVSHKQDLILAELRALARTMTDAEMRDVAKLNYGRDEKKFYAALKKLFERDTLFLNDDETWYPSEVIELSSYVPSSPGFVQCTALLILNNLSENLGSHHTEFRWEQLCKDYKTISEPNQSIISRGFRHLYETNVGIWDPFSMIKSNKERRLRRRLDRFISWSIDPPSITSP